MPKRFRTKIWKLLEVYNVKPDKPHENYLITVQSIMRIIYKTSGSDYYNQCYNAAYSDVKILAANTTDLNRLVFYTYDKEIGFARSAYKRLYDVVSLYDNCYNPKLRNLLYKYNKCHDVEYNNLNSLIIKKLGLDILS